MAKVLQNFLIGVGLDTEKYDKGAKNVESSLGRMRSLVGFTGTAITGAFAAVGVGAINAGKRIDDMALKFEGLKTPPAWINNYGNAIAAFGGHADEAVAAIAAMEAAIAARNYSQDGIMPGEIDLQRAGIDTLSLRQAQTGNEMLRELARQIPGLNKEQQLKVQQTLGFSDGVMRSLREGVGELDAAVARAGELYGDFGKATEAAREYNKVLSEINTQFEGIGETLAQKMLPSFTGILQSTSGFISQNRSAIDKLIGQAADNPLASSLLTGSAATVAVGAAARGVGLQVLGKGLMRAGPYGMAAGTALLGGDAAKDMPWGDWWDISVNSARDSWRRLTDWDDYPNASEGPYGPEVPIVAPGTTTPLTRAQAPLPLNQLNVHDANPIYSGGEVSNAEAANASPDVIMVRDQRQLAESRTAPQRANVQNSLEVRMELDGRALDTKITDVVDRREQNARGEVQSAVSR